MKSTIALFAVSALSATGIQVTHDVCSRAISLSSTSHNDACMTYCDDVVSSGTTNPMLDEEFAKVCAIGHYQIQNGRVKPDHACFSNLVYGYSEGTPQASITPGLYYSTPALCQLACQELDECVQWTWASELSSTENGRRACLLKSLAMVQGAVSQETDKDSNEADPEYCLAGMNALCTNNIYDCLSCETKSRCAWTSSLHVSGWKSCALEVDSCNPDATFSTPQPTPPKFALCNAYASINASLNNDYCIDACNKLMALGEGEGSLNKDHDFVSNCSHEHYTVDSVAKPSGSCFDTLVIGYNEENPLGSMEEAQGLYVDTPALCQLECQKRADCESFTFVTELVAASRAENIHKCLLKSKKMIQEALNMNVASENASVSSQYCNVNIPRMCHEGGYNCLSCKEGEKSCAWNSVYHVGGQKHCAAVKNVCDLRS